MNVPADAGLEDTPMMSILFALFACSGETETTPPPADAPAPAPGGEEDKEKKGGKGGKGGKHE